MNNKLVYILKLQGGKYYVGSTENVEQRLEEHFNGLGSEWTSTYRPVKLLKVYQNCSLDDETYHTLRYMRQYGKENVRGGAFSAVALPSSRQEIRKMLQRHRNDACFNCGSQGHYAADCEFEAGDEVFTRDNPFYGLYNKYSREAPVPSVPNPVTCGRCGRNHPTNACYASFDIRGRDLRNSCGSTSHWASMCYAQRNVHGQNLYQGNYSSNNSCFRCGQSGHWASECSIRTRSSRRSLQRSIFPPKRRPLHLTVRANPFPEVNNDRLDYDDYDSDDDGYDDDGYDDDGYDDYDYDDDY